MQIYATLEEVQAADGKTVDLLLICGDFQVRQRTHVNVCVLLSSHVQAIRNPADLLSLAVPEKYRQLGGFHR